MESNSTQQNKSSSANGSAEHLASHAGAAAANVMDSAKQAGKTVGATAKEELAQLRADLDDLTNRMPNLSDIDLNAAKEKLAAKISAAKAASMEAANNARDQFNRGVEVTGEYVKEKPIQSVSMAAAFGVLIGMLISRR